MSDARTIPERLARIETLLEEVLRAETDKEIRIRWLERKLWVGIGGLTLLTVALKFLH